MNRTFLFFLFEIVYDIEPLLKSESRRQKNLFHSFGYCLEGSNTQFLMISMIQFHYLFFLFFKIKKTHTREIDSVLELTGIFLKLSDSLPFNNKKYINNKYSNGLEPPEELIS